VLEHIQLLLVLVVLVFLFQAMKQTGVMIHHLQHLQILIISLQKVVEEVQHRVFQIQQYLEDLPVEVFQALL
tara:strand:+ start:248 stop:463 length:216 start_codon:yes stop_codon:yes gene_type:complete